MLVYTSRGKRDFRENPATPKTRSAWEFWSLLSGNINFEIEFTGRINCRQASLFVFPPNLQFGCTGQGFCERAIFDFNAVSPELEQFLPPSGYYRVPLQNSDCNRIDQLAELAQESIEKPTQLASLQQKAVVAELSLLALRNTKTKPIYGQEKAQAKVDQAMAWYATNMPEAPTLVQIGQAIHVSPAHLRRLFHKATCKSPKEAFNEIRMERVQHLLLQSHTTMDDIAERVGFADATAVNRAVRRYSGVTPGNLRRRLRRHRSKGY